MPEQQDIRKDDLYLLLDSYKNNIELSTIIMEQLRQISESQINLTENIKGLIDRGNEVTKSLLEIANSMKEYSDSVKNSSDKLIDKVGDYEKHLSVFETEQKGLFAKVGSKINLVYIGMGTLVISLLGIIYLLLEKLHILAEIAEKIGV